MDRTTIITLIHNQQLLNEAFTHRSYLNETKEQIASNERLEFLGDAVLEIIVSEYLFHQFTEFPEGKLTLLRSSIVRTESLSKAALLLDLGNQLRMSRGEEENGGRANKSILANTYEAVLGALYLDQGLLAARNFVQMSLFQTIPHILKNKAYLDAKSNLQEKVQEKLKVTPVYRVLTETGPDHKKIFTVGVFINNGKAGEGSGGSKQEAEAQAATEALKKYT
ncbi:ribonuclease III [Candidatus Roizmanbacteria bacterium]|nr:ribonuclease III [Candidatus Roizmanbacteria bacterium]